MELIQINGIYIDKEEFVKTTYEIIEILSNKNITHATAYMILDNVKEELQNTIVKKCD